MSEKDKVKFIKLTKTQRKLLLADQNKFNEALDKIQNILADYRDEVRKSRIETYAAEHNIEDGFTEGDWIFNINGLRFEKQQEVIPPPSPPPGAEKTQVTRDIPGKKKKKKSS